MMLCPWCKRVDLPVNRLKRTREVLLGFAPATRQSPTEAVPNARGTVPLGALCERVFLTQC